MLENRLDKAMIKYNEAQSIRKTYEQIVKRLREERVGFDNQLSAIERTLGSKQHDYEEVVYSALPSFLVSSHLVPSLRTSCPISCHVMPRLVSFLVTSCPISSHALSHLFSRLVSSLLTPCLISSGVVPSLSCSC